MNFRKPLFLAPVTLALAGCGQSEAPASEAAASAAPVTADASEAPTCAPVKLDVSPNFFDVGRVEFAPGTRARTRIEENFAKAYAEACDEGLLAKKPLIDPRAKQQDTLFLANAPAGNVALLRFDDTRLAPEMLLEGPFFDYGGNVQVPGADAVKEAIYCYAIGATEKEMEEQGRCLVD